MSLQYAERSWLTDVAAPPSPPPLTPTASRLSLATTEVSRWWDPTAQHVTWRLRLTNTGDQSIPRLTALFTYVGHCGSPATGLSVTSRSSRGNTSKSWGFGRSLFKTYPASLAAWETLLLTGVYSSTSNAGGSLSVSFGVGTTLFRLGTVSADF